LHTDRPLRSSPSASLGASRGASPLSPPGLAQAHVVDRSFYDADSLEVAPRVLNKLLARRDAGGKVLVSGRIVEVEAYRGEDDPASHAFKGLTRRNAAMFGPPGHLYVYFTYGMHWCANLVCGPAGQATAVLLRALAPVEGIAEMRAARGGKANDRDLLSGPARLCQAMGIDGGFDGVDLVGGPAGSVGAVRASRPGGSSLVVLDDGVAAPEHPGNSSRIGIRLAADFPWRWWVPGDPNVSKGRPSTSASSKPL
jgi:DNA-3-methyladenine glycosylase